MTPALVIRAASKEGHANAVDVLVRRFAGVANGVGRGGRMSLHNAAMEGHCDVVEVPLLGQDIDVNAASSCR